jgi:hypothetical protein
MTPAERSRLRTFGNLWRSLIPLVVIVGIILVLAWPRSSDDGNLQVVDTAGPISYAKSVAAYPLLAPAGLPSGWRATSTRIDPAPSGAMSPVVFTIGYVTPKGQFAQFRESDDRADAVRASLGAAAELDPRTIGGVQWTALRNSREEVVLLRTVGSVTVYVTGSASDAELAVLAASLSS